MRIAEQPGPQAPRRENVHLVIYFRDSATSGAKFQHGHFLNGERANPKVQQLESQANHMFQLYAQKRHYFLKNPQKRRKNGLR